MTAIERAAQRELDEKRARREEEKCLLHEKCERQRQTIRTTYERPRYEYHKFEGSRSEAPPSKSGIWSLCCCFS